MLAWLKNLFAKKRTQPQSKPKPKYRQQAIYSWKAEPGYAMIFRGDGKKYYGNVEDEGRFQSGELDYDPADYAPPRPVGTGEAWAVDAAESRWGEEEHVDLRHCGVSAAAGSSDVFVGDMIPSGGLAHETDSRRGTGHQGER